MKTTKMKQTVLKVVERVTREEVERDMYRWPPICIGLYHQPKRPKF